jgi:hypothetical protein
MGQSIWNALPRHCPIYGHARIVAGHAGVVPGCARIVAEHHGFFLQESCHHSTENY